jgi:hypothetical protein
MRISINAYNSDDDLEILRKAIIDIQQTSDLLGV